MTDKENFYKEFVSLKNQIGKGQFGSVYKEKS